MTTNKNGDSGLSAKEQSEIQALTEAAQRLISRRGFVAKGAIAWAVPLIETLTTMPEALAQGHGHGHHTMAPTMHGI